MIAILVNGIELDITEDTRTSLTITVGLSEAGDVLKRAPEFAPSVTIPATAKNNQTFGYLNENGIKTGNVWLPVEIYDYPDLILKGNIQVNSFNGVSYNCSCFSSQLDVIAILKNTKLADLDGWEYLDHIYDNTPISQRIAPVQDLLYLRADNGLYRNSSLLAMAPIDLKPAISLQAVIDRMNANLPFAIDISPIPDEATTMLVNGKVIKYDEDYVKTELSNTAELIAATGTTNQYLASRYLNGSTGTGQTGTIDYTFPEPNRITANADSPTNNNIYYDNIGINVLNTQKVKIKLSYIITALLSSDAVFPEQFLMWVNTTIVLNFRNLTGTTIYTRELGVISRTCAALETAFFSSPYQDEFELVLPAGQYFADFNFTNLTFSVEYFESFEAIVNVLFKLNPAFDQKFAIFEGGDRIVRGGLMRAKNILPDLTCFDVIQHLIYLYGGTLDITRDSLGTVTGVQIVRYVGKQSVPLQGNIDFTNFTTQEYGIQSFVRDNIVKYKPDEADPTTNTNAVTTFTCQHTIPNQTRDWYISPFAWTNTKPTFINQLEIASIPNYVLPFGSRYVLLASLDTLLQVNDYYAQDWQLYKVLVNCTVGTLFDSPDNYEQISYSDLGERDLVDRFVRIINNPITPILLTDGLISPVVQELRYNIFSWNQNKNNYSIYLAAIERNRLVEVEAYLTLSDFKYLSSQIFSGNRFTIPELGCDCFLQKIENYSPAVFGKCKLTFLTT